MVCKLSLIPSSILLLLITLTLLISTSDLRSRISFSSSFLSPSIYPLPPPHRLRVYMYDLPPRFNVQMLGSFDQNSPTQFPDWPENAGIKRQHSVEYWLMRSLVVGGEGWDGAEMVRVEDGDEAEVFFVPFFSSLSFNTHGHNMTDPETTVDRQLQVDLVDFLKASKYWQRSGGRDHVIPMSHPNAFRFLRDQVNASIFVLVDFGRYPQSVASLRKDVVAPYVHLVDSFLDDESFDPFSSRKTLLYFRGRTMRKDEGIVRVKLAKILKGYEDIQFEDSLATGEGIKLSTQGMRSSKFCLHPAGDTSSSCRLFDAIVSHCVPVIVSDRIELPFEDEIDHRDFSLFFSVKEALQPDYDFSLFFSVKEALQPDYDFSLFFSVKEALQPDYLVRKLREIPRDRWIEMWMKLKNVSHHYEFRYPPTRGDAINMIWRQVRHKLPAINLAIHRSRRSKIPDWWRRRR